MSSDEYKIDESTWKEQPLEHQTWMLYSTFNAHRDKCDIKFLKLEKRKKIDTAASVSSGFAGGFFAMML